MSLYIRLASLILLIQVYVVQCSWDPEYDYIVAGGGTAGCVVASRLSEDKRIRVLLLEAGPEDNPFKSVPRAFAGTWVNHWGFHSVMQINNATQRLLQGKLLGGSSAINMMVYSRGSPNDYNRWEEDGNTGWSYKDVLPYFKKSENMLQQSLLKDGFHGSNGPVSTRFVPQEAILDEILKAGNETKFAGFAPNDDYNDDTVEGMSFVQHAINSKGQRMDTATAFIKPVMHRPNLKVVTGAMVVKIQLDPKRGRKYDAKATGVHFEKDGKLHFVAARNEVIVSAGALNSPKLLMLSGIGPKQHLEQHNIEVIKELPVGDNLKDDTSVWVRVKINKTSPIPFEKINTFEALFQYLFAKKGPWATPISMALAFYKTSHQPPTDDFPYIENLLTLSYTYIPLPIILSTALGMNIPLESAFKSLKDADQGDREMLMRSILLHPKNSGTVRLSNNQSSTAPVITFLYAKDMDDVANLVEGLKRIKMLMDTDVMKDAQAYIDIPTDICQSEVFASDDYWKCYAQNRFTTAIHFTGSCKMAMDNTGVVDNKLRVKGIKKLRVVDASIIPNGISGHTMAPTIMIAEKASDMIKEKRKLKKNKSV